MCSKPRLNVAVTQRNITSYILLTDELSEGAAVCHLGLTIYLITWRMWWAKNNASKAQMGFNSAFKGLKKCTAQRVADRLRCVISEDDDIVTHYVYW